MEKVFICDTAEDERKLVGLFHGGFWADKAHWQADLGWPKPAYRVTLDETLMRGFVMYVKAVIPTAIVLD